MVTLSFLGDISLNDDYIHLSEKNSAPFSEVSPVLKQSDLVIGNLECLAEGNEGENSLKKPRLKTTLQTLKYLRSINLGLATLAQNHVYDNLYNGFEQSLSFLDKEEISHIGAGETIAKAKKAFTRTLNGISFSILNYLTEDTNPSLPEGAKISLNVFKLDDCVKDLESHTDSDFRIVLLHWGGKFENGLYPDFNQPEIARKIIDAGADLIIGHHSHTFQPYEKYNNKYIFYSIGNFCFSDIHFEGRVRPMSSKRNTESAIINIDFSKEDYSLKVQPIINEGLRIVFRKNLLLKFKFRNFIFSFMRRSKFLWNIYSFNFRVIRPVFVQLKRKDDSRNFLQRMKELNLNKIRKLIQS